MLDMPDFETVWFVDKRVDTTCAVNPSFKQHASCEGRKKVSRAMLNTSSCDTVRTALLWCESHSKTLIKPGFKLNPHDLSFANKMINNHQRVITWFVDDSKISHVEEQVIRDALKKIEDNFRSVSTVCGQRKELLGMSLEFLDNGNFLIDVRSYLHKAINEFDKNYVLQKLLRKMVYSTLTLKVQKSMNPKERNFIK